MNTEVIDWQFEKKLARQEVKKFSSANKQTNRDVVLQVTGFVYVNCYAKTNDKEQIKERVSNIVEAGYLLYGEEFLKREQQIERAEFLNEHLKDLQCRVVVFVLNDIKKEEKLSVVKCINSKKETTFAKSIRAEEPREKK